MAGRSGTSATANGGTEAVVGWTPEPDADARAGTMRRRDLDGRNDAGVAVLAMPEAGQQFLIENNAWGVVHVADPPTYVAMYVRGDVREVRYVATVHDIVAPDAAPMARAVSAYEDDIKIHNWKKLIRFEPKSLFELEDPIPYESRYPTGGPDGDAQAVPIGLDDRRSFLGLLEMGSVSGTVGVLRGCGPEATGRTLSSARVAAPTAEQEGNKRHE
ncbi:MAG: hypothetical protein U5K37_11510 [Natrialbaceae archaeon]|nr:hypothetical protein [Natrialbaceae archaeon]